MHAIDLSLTFYLFLEVFIGLGSFRTFKRAPHCKSTDNKDEEAGSHRNQVKAALDARLAG
jgi:hypothetical protein